MSVVVLCQQGHTHQASGKAEKSRRTPVSSVLTVLAHKQQQLTRSQRGGYLPLLPDGQATCEAVHELLQFVA